jgi:hypothetical protein
MTSIECLNPNAKQIVSEWLPEYGHEKEKQEILVLRDKTRE